MMRKMFCQRWGSLSARVGCCYGDQIHLQKQAKKTIVKDSAWIKEGTMDDPLDFMSEGAIRRVVGRVKCFTSSQYVFQMFVHVDTYTARTHTWTKTHTHTHTQQTDLG